MMQKSDGETLEDYLNNRVFANAISTTIEPDESDVKGFNAYIEKYKQLLKVEQTAVENL